MTTKFLKSGLLTLVVSAFTMFALTSCDKDDDVVPATLKNQIVGTWNITSFKVDTSEYMGVLVDTSIIKFDAYTGAQGNFQHKIRYSDDELENLTGKYEVDETKKEVKMVVGSQTEVVKITFPASGKIEWTGVDNGKPVKVKAQKK